MKTELMFFSYATLVTLIGAPIGVFLGKLEIEQSNWIMLVCTILWFATAPLWMGRKDKDNA